jgi:hypothetical protein
MTLSAGQFDPRSQDFLARDVHDPHNYTPNPHFRNVDRGQGRLFAEQQWKRGYGPTRQAAVESFITSPRGTDKTIPLHRAAELIHPIDVHEAIKQTTIPVSHLRSGIRDIQVDATMNPGSAGTYSPNDRTVRINKEASSLPLHHIVAHEIGHSQAHRIMGPAAVDYRGSGVGTTEGMADAYSQAHAPVGKEHNQGYTAYDMMFQHKNVATKLDAMGVNYHHSIADDLGAYVHTLKHLGGKTPDTWQDVDALHERAMKLKGREPGNVQQRIFHPELM